jgi:hypothetical protein
MDAWSAQPVGRDRRAQVRVVLVPLPGITKRRDAVGQLAQREPGVGRGVVEMEMRVDQAWQDGPARQVDARPAAAEG